MNNQQYKSNYTNQSLSIDDKNIITYCYRKSLRPICGSVTATILFQQLICWFSKYETFYKFTSPCDHKSYNHGDSWTEELGFSEKEFKSAFAKIGTKYNSKRQFDESEDKFKGKYFAAYHNKVDGTTHYFANYELLNKIDFTV